MMRTLPIFLFAAFLSPVAGYAQESCPWVNGPTAEAVVNAPVEMQVTHPDPDHHGDITCAFTGIRHGSNTRELRIEVQTITKTGNQYAAATARCLSKPVILKAVGNEAATCDLNANQQHVAQAFGRTRDKVFIVQITTNDRAWAAQDVLIEKVSKIAEIVAGNLF